MHPTCTASSRFVLPGADRALQHRDAVGELELGARVTAEVADLEARDVQGTRYTLRRTGMIR